MSEHTPGPWTIDPVNTTMVFGPTPEGEPYRYIIDCDSTFAGDGDCDEANARLIAAAPDLLTTCEAALEELCPEWCRSGPMRGTSEDCRECGAALLRDRMRAVIAKAKGE